MFLRAIWAENGGKRKPDAPTAEPFIYVADCVIVLVVLSWIADFPMAYALYRRSWVVLCRKKLGWLSAAMSDTVLFR